MEYKSRGQSNNILEWISWVPALVVVCFIFYMSSQNGITSDEVSIGMADKLTKGTFLGIKVKTFNAIIRTIAHIGEYMLLSLFVGLAVSVNHIWGKMRFLYMCFLSLVVSLADEFFQIFIPGRYCDIRDVICDMLGSFVVALLVLKIFKREHISKANIEKRRLLGITVDNITFDDAISKVCNMAKSSTNGKYILTPNVDHIIKLQKDELFREIYDNADLVVTDGTPLMWIAESTGEPIREKIPGSDMLPRVCEEAAKRGLSVFICGADKGVAKEAANRLKARYKGLKVAGTYSPPFGFEKDEALSKKVIDYINDKKPDILVLGLGSPKQEKFMYKHRDEIQAKVFLPFGAAIDFEAGRVRRAPQWMRDRGLEWFYRFINEPGRLFKRYFVDDLQIFWITWKHRKDTFDAE